MPASGLVVSVPEPLVDMGTEIVQSPRPQSEIVACMSAAGLLSLYLNGPKPYNVSASLNKIFPFSYLLLSKTRGNQLSIPLTKMLLRLYLVRLSD